LIKTERPLFERIALLLQGGGALGSYQAENQRGHRRDQCDAELHNILRSRAQMMLGQCAAHKHGEQRAVEHQRKRDALDRYCAENYLRWECDVPFDAASASQCE
jgi:hypothetical protein